MWFKKKSVLQGEGHYDKNTAVDGYDWRTTDQSVSWSPTPSLPSAADAGKYFYLPALGDYSDGLLYNVGSIGTYWSSSARPWSSYYAYVLYFNSGSINVDYNGPRTGGNRVGGFE